MTPFYVAATVLVVGVLVVGSWFSFRGRPLDVRSVQSRGTPSASRAQAHATFVPQNVRGNAPWALSALPECFRQEKEVHGPAGFVRTQLPAGARVLPAGTTLYQADCVVRFGDDAIVVERGDVHLAIPPHARGYAAAGSLAILRQVGTSADLRIYRASDGGALSL